MSTTKLFTNPNTTPVINGFVGHKNLIQTRLVNYTIHVIYSLRLVIHDPITDT